MSDKYNKITHEFIEFKTTLNKEINNNNSKFNSNNECYCIKEDWYNKIEQQINDINTKKNLSKDTKSNLIRLFLLKNSSEFINDISSALYVLENRENIKLISKNFVHSSFSPEFYLKYNSVKYYAGNNRLIIKFKIENSELSNILLLINPLEKILPKKEIYFFSAKIKANKKNDIFRNLIDNEITEKLFSSLKISAKKLKLSNEFSNELKENKSTPSEKSNESINLILKFLIAIYYYEMTLTNKNKTSIINKNERSYLIYPEWIQNIKSYYNYDKIIKILNNIKKEIDYSNFIDEIEQVYNELKNNSELENIQFSEELFTKRIIPKEKAVKDYSFIETCYILPKRIIQIINNLLSNYRHSIHSIAHFWKKNNICILNKNIIYIGILNNLNVFIAEYVLFYTDSDKLSNSEFDYLFSLSNINDYFQNRNCSDTSNNLQKIYNNGKSIGKLLSMKNLVSSQKNNNEKDLNIFINKKEVKKDKKIHRSSSIPKKYENLDSKLMNKLNTFELSNYKNEKQKNLNRSVIETNEHKNKNLKNNNKDLSKISLDKFMDKTNIEKNEDDILMEENEEKNDINKNENELNKLKNLNQKLQEELAKEKNKNKDSEKIIIELKLELSKSVNSEKESIRQSLKKDKEIDNISKLKEELENKYEALEKKIKTLEEKLIEKEELASNSLKESQRKDDDIKNISFENNLLKEENEKLKKKFDKLEKKYNKVKEKLEKKEKDIEDKIIDPDYTEEKTSKENESKISHMKKKIDKYTSENELLKQKNDELSQLNNLLQIELDEKKKEIEKIKKNTKKKNASQINNQNMIINIDQYENNNINEKDIYDNINKNKESNKKKRSQSMPSTKQKPIDTYLQPTLIGLNNIGATCYMNATLQCLSQTADLTNYFLSEKNQNYIDNINFELTQKNELCLTKVYLNLVKKLWSKKDFQSSFSPKKFFETVSSMNPLFQKGDPGDSKDFIIYILEQIHRELKKSIANLTNIKKVEELNQYDKQNAFNNFFEDFKKECSIISDVFFGFNETTNICLNCKNNYNSKGMVNPICYNY